MIAANNLINIFDYLMPIVTKKCPKEQILQILNKQNSSNSTPLRTLSLIKDYAVVTDSKEMVTKLI